MEESIEEKEVSLIDLIKFIWSKKVIISLFTILSTILIGVYVSYKMPVYEVNSIVKIGYIKDKQLENAELLVKKLNIIYNVGRPTNVISKDKAIVSSISKVKKLDDLITISTQAFSNKIAIQKNKEVLDFIRNEYQLKIDEYKFNISLEVENLTKALNKINKVERISIQNQIKKLKEYDLVRIDKEIEILNTQTIKAIDKKIKFYENIDLKHIENKLNFNKQKIKEYKENIKNISSKPTNNNTQELINSTQIVSNQNLILNLQDKIEDLNREKANILNIEIKKLENERKNLLEIDLKELQGKRESLKNEKLNKLVFQRDVLLKEKSDNIKNKIKQEERKLTQNYLSNSYILGEMIVNDYPIKPRKILIIVLTFLSSFIFITFISLLIYVLGNKKENI